MPFCKGYYLVGGAGGDWAVRAGVGVPLLSRFGRRLERRRCGRTERRGELW